MFDTGTGIGDTRGMEAHMTKKMIFDRDMLGQQILRVVDAPPANASAPSRTPDHDATCGPRCECEKEVR